jgi:hypothetical protein
VTVNAPDENHLAYEDEDGADRPRTLLSLLGPISASHEAVLRTVAQRVTVSGRRPVVAASQLGRDFMVDGTLAIELLPRRCDLSAFAPGEYAAYLKRRWDTLLAKWQITEEITLGQSFDSFLATEIASCPQEP